MRTLSAERKKPLIGSFKKLKKPYSGSGIRFLCLICPYINSKAFIKFLQSAYQTNCATTNRGAVCYIGKDECILTLFLGEEAVLYCRSREAQSVRRGRGQMPPVLSLHGEKLTFRTNYTSYLFICQYNYELFIQVIAFLSIRQNGGPAENVVFSKKIKGISEKLLTRVILRDILPI